MDKIFVGFFKFSHKFHSPKVKQNYIIITRKKMYELPNNLRVDERLKAFKKIPEMPGIDGKYPAGHQKVKF